MMKKIPAVLILIFMAAFAVAQQSGQPTGRILDGSGHPIPYASIRILNTETGVHADQSGRYSIPALPAGNYIMEVSAIGYATQTLALTLPVASLPDVRLQLSSARLDEVVVSAQKKEENLQQVPVAVSALNARQVRQYRLWNSQDLTAIVPNLYSANSGDDRNVTSLRGIATTSYDPAVATYIDGVNQFGLDTYIASLFDIERIEVLRGPQGTLYGRNAMGGVINIITRAPDNLLHAFGEYSVGNYGQQRLSAGIRMPLLKNKLFLGVAGLYDARDGFYTNDYNQQSYDRQHSITGNYYLKWLPGKGWDATINVKHHNNRNEGAFPLVFGVTDAFAHPFHLNQNATATMIDNTVNASLSIQHQGRQVDFSSQTAWQKNRRTYDHPLDGDFSPIDGITILNDYSEPWNRVKVLTQEFRLHSAPSASAPFQWTTGLYLFRQDNPVKQATHFGNDAEMLGSPDKNFSVINSTKGISNGAALYGQISYPLRKNLQLIAGLRYDYEHKKYSVLGEYQPDGGPVFTTRPDTSATVHYGALSPHLGISWLPASNHQFYLSYSRGFRTGGLTQLSTDPSQPPLYPFQPEYSNNFEAGLKNSWLENRLRLNLAFFYTLVNDAQVPTLILPDAITVTKNAGRLQSKGAELELAATPVNGLELQENLGYTHARFTDLKLSMNGSETDLSGNHQVFTPDITSHLALQYSKLLSEKSGLRAMLRGEWAYLGTQYFDLANSIKQDGYSLLNLRVGFALKGWEITGWVRNLGDKKYIGYAYDFGAVHLGNPRTLGLSLRWQL